jgi:hypothetical protein
MPNPKTERRRKVYIFLVAVIQTLLRKYMKFKLSKSDAFKKEKVHKYRPHPNIDYRFSTWRKSAISKIMPSTRPLPDTTNKGKPWVFTLKR